MTNYTSIQAWLETNPSDADQKKVLNLINRVAFNEIRKTVGDKERSLRKLLRLANDFKDINMKVPKEVETAIKDLNSEVVALKKTFPLPTKRQPKELKSEE